MSEIPEEQKSINFSELSKEEQVELVCLLFSLIFAEPERE